MKLAVSLACGIIRRWIRKALKDKGGLSNKQIKRTLGALRKIIREMKSEGQDFELDPRMRKYLEHDVELTEKQIGLVLGISRRLLHSRKRPGGGLVDH